MRLNWDEVQIGAVRVDLLTCALVHVHVGDAGVFVLLVPDQVFVTFQDKDNRIFWLDEAYGLSLLRLFWPRPKETQTHTWTLMPRLTPFHMPGATTAFP